MAQGREEELAAILNRLRSGLPEAPVETAIGDLREHLEIALAIFNDVAQVRSLFGAIIAINAVYAFIERVDQLRERELSLPLATLAGALADLDRGILADFLKPRDWISGDSRTGIGLSIIKESAAAFMSILMHEGFSRGDSATTVARILNANDVKLEGHRQLTARTVAGWRDAISPGDECYEHVLSLESEWATDRKQRSSVRNPEQIAELVRLRLTAIIRRVRT